MALDVFGNWVPPILDELDPEPPTGGEPLSGSGAPSDAIGNDGQLYVDEDTGDLYTKSGGTWILYSGSGGAGGLVGVVDPEGVVTADPGTIYTNTANRTIWIKESGTGTNTGWFMYV